MIIWQYILFISCFIIFYNYAGYALIVYLINNLNRKGGKPKTDDLDFSPSISFIVAAYNEEDFIEKKIINSIHQNYPAEKIEFIFITDGSTDKTREIIGRYPSIILLHKPERKGKSAALNRVAKIAKNDILIFSDANTFLNIEATKNIASHYIDDKVGGVAGEKKVSLLAENSFDAGDGEGAYWKYESFLKKIDSAFYSVVGAAGELFSVRRELYEPIADEVILDDFVISLKVAQKGFRIIYEPDAYAMELPSFSLKDEQKRKIRIAAGGFQAIWMLKSLFMFWNHPKLSFLYISHRVLRWALSPFCLLIAFISSLFLFLESSSSSYKILFLLQILFYLFALTGKFISSSNNRFKILKLCYYFVFMNISVIMGFFRFIRGKQPATWEKAKRTQSVLSE
ncbi:MAG: glycosyltransferase family 2 protein [Chitinophagaceae bacterium]